MRTLDIFTKQGIRKEQVCVNVNIDSKMYIPLSAVMFLFLSLSSLNIQHSDMQLNTILGNTQA